MLSLCKGSSSDVVKPTPKPNDFTQCSGCNGTILNSTFDAHFELCQKEVRNKRKRVDNDHKTNNTSNKKQSKWAPLAGNYLIDTNT